MTVGSGGNAQRREADGSALPAPAAAPRGPVLPPEHHRELRGGGARAAVFGISDGLLSNVSLILGVAGAHPNGSWVRLAGLAGLIAGAFSMAGGEYISMQAQRELFERELALERSELTRHAGAERKELARIYELRGVEPAAADTLAEAMMSDLDLALKTHAREELGIDPEALGSPVQAALSSFVAFAIGALLPLLPWFFVGGTAGIVASVVIGAVASIAIGVAVARLAGQPVLHSALRQLGVSAAAASVTFGVGRLVGASGAV